MLRRQEKDVNAGEDPGSDPRPTGPTCPRRPTSRVDTPSAAGSKTGMFANDKALHQSFAQYLYRRMHDRHIELVKVELAWNRTHLDTGKQKRQVLGTFEVGPPAAVGEAKSPAPSVDTASQPDEGDVDE